MCDREIPKFHASTEKIVEAFILLDAYIHPCLGVIFLLDLGPSDDEARIDVVDNTDSIVLNVVLIYIYICMYIYIYSWMDGENEDKSSEYNSVFNWGSMNPSGTMSMAIGS